MYYLINNLYEVFKFDNNSSDDFFFQTRFLIKLVRQQYYNFIHNKKNKKKLFINFSLSKKRPKCSTVDCKKELSYFPVLWPKTNFIGKILLGAKINFYFFPPTRLWLRGRCCASSAPSSSRSWSLPASGRWRTRWVYLFCILPVLRFFCLAFCVSCFCVSCILSVFHFVCLAFVCLAFCLSV